MKIGIVAGHSFKVVGASANGHREEAWTRKIVAEVIPFLRALGHEVVDCTDNDGNTKEQVWSNAARNCNNANVDIAVSVHMNEGGGTGIEVYDYKGSQCGTTNRIANNVSTALGIKNRGVKDGSWIGFINTTKAPAILIETCFIDNVDDMAKLQAKLSDAAKAIAEGITGQRIVVSNAVTHKVTIPNTAFWQARSLVSEFEGRGYKCYGVAGKQYQSGQEPQDNDPYQFVIECNLDQAKALVIELQSRGYDRTYGEQI